jgi:hypothetical protein
MELIPMEIGQIRRQLFPDALRIIVNDAITNLEYRVRTASNLVSRRHFASALALARPESQAVVHVRRSQARTEIKQKRAAARAKQTGPKLFWKNSIGLDLDQKIWVN